MDDETLFKKLQRQYSKDEVIQLLNKKISELHIEIGILKSYIAELEDEKNIVKIDQYNILKKERNKFFKLYK